MTAAARLQQLAEAATNGCVSNKLAIALASLRARSRSNWVNRPVIPSLNIFARLLNSPSASWVNMVTAILNISMTTLTPINKSRVLSIAASLGTAHYPSRTGVKLVISSPSCQPFCRHFEPPGHMQRLTSNVATSHRTKPRLLRPAWRCRIRPVTTLTAAARRRRSAALPIHAT